MPRWFDALFDRDVIPDRYVGDGQLMEELATKAGLPLRSLPAHIRETSASLARA
jgi:hypothetical protein